MASETYLSIVGSKQGKFQGDSPGQPWKSKIVSVGYNLAAPRDLASGQSSGRRQHKPITVTKEWGAASPQMLQALVSDEPLHVKLETVDRNGAVYQTVTLTGAKVVSIRSQGTSSGKHPKHTNQHEIEIVEITFQKIEVSTKGSNKSGHDDWFTG